MEIMNTKGLLGRRGRTRTRDPLLRRRCAPRFGSALFSDT